MVTPIRLAMLVEPNVEVDSIKHAAAMDAEPPPDDLENAVYVFDGDDNLVMSVVNAVTTYYVGGYYEKSVDGETVTERKYYMAGSTTIAMRTIVGETDTLNWLLSDHLGSTSVTADESGVYYSELRYTAYGEVRYSDNSTPTDRRYTAQRIEEEVNLYFYQSRWYDPASSQFVQPDTSVPDALRPQDWSRYAYSRNNPLFYTDPTGKRPCNGEIFDGTCDRTYENFGYFYTVKLIDKISQNYGIEIKGSNWNLTQVKEINNALSDMEKGIGTITNGNGRAWIKKNLGGVNVRLGGIITDVLKSSYDFGTTIHLRENFEKRIWDTIYYSVENHIIHEFGHAWEEKMHPGATWVGGGAGDALLDFVGGRSTKIFRYLPNSLDVPAANLFANKEGFGYGNNSPADYFAHSFLAAIVAPDSSNAPVRAVLWVTALIDLTK
jgi:RHS repeat-associated protein